jgi:hypothetical protein
MPAFFGPFGETGITPSKKCSSAPLPEVRCDVQTVVEPGTPRVGGRWSASIAPGQARALQQGQGAVAHRSPRWPRSPSPWHKRIVGSPPTGWPPTVNQDGTCKLRCAELTAPAEGPYLRSQARFFWAAKLQQLLTAGRAREETRGSRHSSPRRRMSSHQALGSDENRPRRSGIIGGFILRSSLVFFVAIAGASRTASRD